MSSVNDLLAKRLRTKEKSSKMAEMAERSATGNLTSFSGVFSVVELNESEKGTLEAILHEYSVNPESIQEDLTALISVTSEVKAINNQAAILHGERIKKAQEILKSYKEGAFTTWLVKAYGNRQTPYNFLKYFEFYTAMPKNLHTMIEIMPRQAIYTLAARDGSLEKKKQIIENYNGETKSEVLTIIRSVFPLADQDKRKENVGEMTIRALDRLIEHSLRGKTTVSKAQKKVIFERLDYLYDVIEQCKTR